MFTESAANARAARKKAGLTQQQSADLLGVHLRSWQRWEYGKRVMSPAYFEMFLILSKEHDVHSEAAAGMERKTGKRPKAGGSRPNSLALFKPPSGIS